MIEELISKGQQLDAVHFTYEVGLVDRFPPVPLLKAFLKDAKKGSFIYFGRSQYAGRAVQLAARKEQSALRAVMKCIESTNSRQSFPQRTSRNALSS
ncbi:hypothetical protein ES319_1Z162900v1 [Gossypium barbadense]|uniref:FRIGIDA-like protein n=1 Tax=Gossypium barbadense TaxID=3634 RepID=A0A5J5NBZ1_GOSBA|nr:hypothetical protein ES319_1Z162900v1 [Gossypium barbadense]